MKLETEYRDSETDLGPEWRDLGVGLDDLREVISMVLERRPLEEIRSKGIANVAREKLEEIRTRGIVPTLRSRVEEIVERVRSRGEMTRSATLTREGIGISSTSEEIEGQKLKKVRRGL